MLNNHLTLFPEIAQPSKSGDFAGNISNQIPKFKKPVLSLQAN